MNRFARPLIALSGATLLALGAVAPAQAQSWARNDATGDVTVTTCDSTGENCTDSLAAAGNQPDVVRVVTTHTTTQAKSNARFADITTSGLRVHQMRVVTGAGRHVRLTVVTSNGAVQLKQLTRDSDDARIACSGLVFKPDYTGNTVLMAIPQSCLGNPSYVRIGYGSAIITSETKWRADDALYSGLEPSTVDLKLGPSLSRY